MREEGKNHGYSPGRLVILFVPESCKVCQSKKKMRQQGGGCFSPTKHMFRPVTFCASVFAEEER